MQLEQYLNQLLELGLVHNIAIRAGIRDDILLDLYHSRTQKLDDNTMFDMASVTKILATTTLSLIAIDENKLGITDKVGLYFPVDKYYKDLTVQNLLTHTMGIGYRALNSPEINYENIAQYILTLHNNPIGRDVEYSCPAFILMGKILEQLYGKRIDVLFEEKVAKPLNMHRTTFCPNEAFCSNMVNSNIEASLLGNVNDYNCRHLGGIAGNAGIFSCLSDMTLFVKMLLSNGEPIISKHTMDCATKNYTPAMCESRGIGFLWVDDKYSQTGNLFPYGSIGHCGHTGTSFFLNRETGLYVIILSDATISTVKKYGTEDYVQVKKMRQQIHNLIKEEFLL